MTSSHALSARRSGRTRAQWAKLARGFQRQTIKGLIGLGKTLIKAKDDLAHGEWGKMLRDDLKMDESFAQRVMKIARDPRLSNPANWPDLPSVLSALMPLRSDRLSHDDFEAAKASGVINPSMTAVEAKLLTIQAARVAQSLTIEHQEPETRMINLTVSRQPVIDGLIERLDEIARELLSGEQLETALDCLAQLRSLLTNQSGTVVPFPPAS